MFTGIFKSNYTFLIGVLFILALLLWLNAFINPLQICSAGVFAPFYSIIVTWFQNKFLNIFMAFLLVFSQVIFLNTIISNYSLLPQRNYIPALIYLLLMSFSPSFYSINPVMITNLFLLIILNNLFKIYDTPEDYERIFGTGFLTAIASMFYFPSVYLLIVIWIAFIIFRLFNLRAWIITLVGLMTPYLFLMVYYFWFDQLELVLKGYAFFFVGFNKIVFPSDIFIKILFISFLVLVLFSVIRFFNTVSDKVIRVRNLGSILIWLFIVTLFSFFITGIDKVHHVEILFIPVSVFVSNFLYIIKKTYISDIILFIMFAAIVFGKFYF